MSGRWNVRRRMAGLLVIVLLAAACTNSRPQPEEDKSGPGPAVVAFRSEGKIRFADARGNVWGEVPVGQMLRGAVWSADGKHFAWLDAESRLHIVEAATGVDRSQPCPCVGIDRLGDEFAAVSSDGAAMLLFNPANGSTRVPLEKKLLPGAVLIAGGREAVVIAESVPEEIADHRAQSTVLAISRDGKARNMIAGKSRGSIWDGRTSPDGSGAVVVDWPSNGACWTLPGLIDLDGKALNPETKAAVPDDEQFSWAVLKEVRTVSGVSWAGESALATFGPNEACQSVVPERYVTYALTAGAWELVRVGAAAVGFGGDERAYSIDITGFGGVSEQPRARGKLVQTYGDDAHKVLAEQTTMFWLTPAEQAAGRLKAIKPEERKITVADSGTQIAKDFTELADEVTKALTSNDVSRLEKLCSACDPDTRALLRTQEGRDALRKALRTHPAGDDRAVTYPGLAVHRCADGGNDDFPECTADQFHDIGVLGLSSSIAEVFPARVYSAPNDGSIRFVRDSSGKAVWGGRSISAQKYRQKASFAGAEEYYFFQTADGQYLCGFDKEHALCQGGTKPVPPRPPSCGEGPGWGGGMYVNVNREVDFVCAGGLVFGPADNKPLDQQYILASGQTISELGFTCSVEGASVRCSHDASGRGFRIAPDSNERF